MGFVLLEVSAALMEESSDDEDVMNPYRTKSQDDMKGMTREGKLPEDLAQPEFEGLWNSAPKPYRVSAILYSNKE